MIILNKRDIEALLDLPTMAKAIEEAYRAASLGHVNLPPVGHITFDDVSADCHIKYGHLKGDDNFVIKVATGFPQNSDKDLPTGNGMVLVLSAQTGQVRAMLHDEMLLTDVRTGLGGAIASRLLARHNSKNLLIVGTGPQAKWQIQAHKALMPQLETFALWGRHGARADSAVADMSNIVNVTRASDLADAVREADIIVTATGAHEPLILSAWVKPGTHITAVGADAPGKQELEMELVTRADICAVDLISQCVDHGEVSHAVAAGLMHEDQLIELGTLLGDRHKGRSDDAQITVADLTGIAAQDIAIANALLQKRNARANSN